MSLILSGTSLCRTFLSVPYIDMKDLVPAFGWLNCGPALGSGPKDGLQSSLSPIFISYYFSVAWLNAQWHSPSTTELLVRGAHVHITSPQGIHYQIQAIIKTATTLWTNLIQLLLPWAQCQISWAHLLYLVELSEQLQHARRGAGAGICFYLSLFPERWRQWRYPATELLWGLN